VETAGRIKIAPSIAAADQSRLGCAVRSAARAGADLIHLDIEDGVFIPNITFGPAMVRALRPHTDLPFDVHVELAHPEPYLEDLAIAGANQLTVHVEACPYLHRTVRAICSLGLTAGVAFNAVTPLDALHSVLDEIAVIHLMTADPDVGGARFIPALLEKVQQAARMIGDRPIAIEVDGGINQENARQVVRAGASILVVGRAMWAANSPTRALAKLRALAHGDEV
jgi:ribulose-phosphate 3-epimerase